MTDTAEPVAETPDPVVRTYLGWAVAATVLCFLPLGLVGVYFGWRTQQDAAQGRLEAAAHHSQVAKGWVIATIVIGLAIYAFLSVVFALLGAFSR
jgi:heme/copper-type cytochrome/quinol oxidase subunit 2